MVNEFEKRLVDHMLGPEALSGNLLLVTDGYKFSMAQAGFPLREETFHLSFRKGGPFYIPIDLEKVVRNLLSRLTMPTTNASDFLEKHGYGLTPAMAAAVKAQDEVHIWAAPEGSWVQDKEPVLTITGPSFLISWLEPLAIMLHFPIQIGTAIKKDEMPVTFTATCADEAHIVRLICDSMRYPVFTDVDSKTYHQGVADRTDALVKVLCGEDDRFTSKLRMFEVGLRAATCLQQHLGALYAMQQRGVVQTSNVFGAHLFNMIPVGTTGHEHQQRWGNDLDAFRAVRDMRDRPPSYLFDTYDAMKIGIPAMVQAMREVGPTTADKCSIRFDNYPEQDAQFQEFTLRCKHAMLPYPTFIFEDGFNEEKTQATEDEYRDFALGNTKRLYGYGGHLTTNPDCLFTRNKVSAVYKLCRSSGQARMKFSNSGKESIPGIPKVVRRLEDGVILHGKIIQGGELPGDGFQRIEDVKIEGVPPMGTVVLSEQTQLLRDALVEKRDAMMKE